MRRLPEHNARQGFLERADLEALVAALPDDLQDFTRFAYLTAWRRGEVATLRWSDIDRAGAVIAFQRPVGNTSPDTDPAGVRTFSVAEGGARWSVPIR